MSYSQTWLEDTTRARGVLVVAQAYNVLTTLTENFYFSNVGFNTTSGDVSFNPIISSNLKLSENLSFDSSVSVSYGDIEVLNPNGEYDTWLDNTKYIWANKPLKVYYGDPAWTVANLAAISSVFNLVFDGVVSDIDSSSKGKLNFKIVDKQQRLNGPVTEVVIGTTGTWSGGQTNQDQVQPLVFGEVHNITPVLIDPSLLKYLVCQGGCESIIEIRDNGVPIYRQDGQYTGAIVDLTTGTFTLKAPAAGTITCSVQGKKSVGNDTPLAGNTLDLVFTGGTLDPRITFTRASTASYFNSGGVLTSAGNDTPRFDYDPTTLESKGLLVEEARTNYIRNNMMTGAVAGTPGTAPTNWQITGLVGLSTAVVGTGTQNGIKYVDIRLFGTTTLGVAYSAIFTETGTAIPASNGQTWAYSKWVSVVGGSTANLVGLYIMHRFTDSGGGALTTQNTSLLTATSTPKRYVSILQAANATTAYITAPIVFQFNTGVAIDITLRIGMPQMELCDSYITASSVIPTTAGQASRAADIPSVNTLTPWYNTTSGTLYSEAQLYYEPGIYVVSAQLDDGTVNNRISLRRGGTLANIRYAVAGVLGNSDFTSGDPVGINRIALAYASGDQAAANNGSLFTITPTSGTPTVTTLSIGRAPGAASQWFGWIRRIVYYPTRLSNSELQTITGVSTYTNNVCTAIRQLVTEYGIPARRLFSTDINTASFDSLSTSLVNTTGAVGVYVTDRENLLELCQRLAGSVGAQVYFSRTGSLKIVRLVNPSGATSTFSITDSDIIQGSLNISNRTEVQGAAKVAYAKNWTVQQNLATNIPSSSKESFATEWLLETQVDSAVADLYQTNRDPVQKDTLLVAVDGAVAEAARLLNYFKTTKTCYRFMGTSRLLGLELGQIVNITHSRFGLSGGKNAQVISLSPDWSKSQVEVEVVV